MNYLNTRTDLPSDEDNKEDKLNNQDILNIAN